MWRSAFVLLFSGLVMLAIAADGSRGQDNGFKENKQFEYLRQQFALFQSMPPSRQKKIRELDHQIHSLPEAQQTQFHKVMNNYLIWLSHLSKADREKVLSAGDGVERLLIITQIRRKEWIESLPKNIRDRYEQATLDERHELLLQWREDEQIRDEEWALLQRGEQIQETVRKLFESEEVKKHLEPYLENQIKSLGPVAVESGWISRYRSAKNETDFVQAAGHLYQLSKRHPLLPGNGPRSWDKLDPTVQKQLEKSLRPLMLKQFGARKFLPGRWPDYALEIHRIATAEQIKLPPLGPARLEEMPVEVKTFVEKTLIPKLNETNEGKAELTKWKEQEGRWPDYPTTLMQLAKQHHLTVPGWSLPSAHLFAELIDPLLKRDRKP